MPRDLRPPRILLAEDDSAIHDLIVMRLGLAGYHTLSARDGCEALALMRRARPDAVVLDINMPGLDGFAVLDSMSRSPLLAPIPVLVLTARHAAEDVRRAIKLGASDYLAKPFDDTRLLARVARLCSPPRQIVNPTAGDRPAPAEDDTVFI